MGSNPLSWDDVLAPTGAQPVAPQSSPGQAPGVIYGRPKPPPQPSPQTAAQATKDQLEVTKDQLAIQKAQKELDAGPTADAAEAERKNAAFLQRAIGANQKYESLGIGPRSYIGDKLAENAPSLLNNLPASIGNSPERQMADAAEMEFLIAILRSDSGATVTPDELEQNRRTYFPQSGDSEETIKAKASARARAIEGLRSQTGRMAPSGDQAPAAPPGQYDTRIGHLPIGEQKQWTMQDTIAQWGEELYDENGKPLGPDGGGAYDKQGNYVGLTGRVTATGPNEPTSFGQGFGEGVADVILNAASFAGTTNPGEAIAGRINALMGTELPTLQGNSAIVRQGLDRAVDASPYRSDPWGKAAGQFVAALPTMVIPNPIAGGAVGGALMAEDPQNLVDVGTNAAVGATFGKVGEMGANALAARSAAKAAAKADDAARVGALADAGQAEGVTVNKAMADPSLANRVSGVDSSLAGGPSFQKGMNAIEGQIEGRVSDLGMGGTALNPEEAGTVLKGAADRIIDKTGKSAKLKYDRAEKLAGGAKVEAKQSLAEVDQMISQLSETPGSNAAEITFLKTLKADLTGKADDATRIIDERLSALGPEQSSERAFLEGLRGEVGGEGLTVGALRRLRTSMRKRISKGELTFGEDEARVLSIMDKAADDIRVGLTAQGKPGAARAFDAADKAYRARMDYINGTIQKVIGKRNSGKAPEDVFRTFSNMARGRDAGNLRKFYASLDANEAADVAATFADELGRNAKGDFSVAHFLSQANKFSDSALVTIFGQRGAQSIKNLRLLGDEVTRVTGAMNSRSSKTGVANDYRSWLFNTLLGAAPGAVSGNTGTALAGAGVVAGLKAGRDILSARALLSPNLSKWIEAAPRTMSPKAINAHFARLTALAASEPALAPEIEMLKSYIMKAANDNAGRLSGPSSAVAEGGNKDERGRIPPQE